MFAAPLGVHGARRKRLADGLARRFQRGDEMFARRRRFSLLGAFAVPGRRFGPCAPFAFGRRVIVSGRLRPAFPSFRDVALLEMAALGEVIKRSPEFVRRQFFGQGLGPQGVGIGHHGVAPRLAGERRQQTDGRQQFVEGTAPLAAPAQLPPHHALGASRLIERRAVGVARLREYPDAEAENAPGFSLFVEVDDGEANRCRANVKTKMEHDEIPARARLPAPIRHDSFFL